MCHSHGCGYEYGCPHHHHYPGGWGGPHGWAEPTPWARRYAPRMSREEELAFLKEQAEASREELEVLQSRIEKLEAKEK